MQIDLPGRGLTLEVESHGKPSDPAVIMIMGLGMQLIYWPPELIQALIDAGFRVLVFDNRDCGLSGTRIEQAYTAPRKALLAHLFKRPFRPAYRLCDMAEDTLALADALGIDSFHVVGASLGGMVAQGLAARWPDRVLSLASMMSSAGPDTAPWPTPRAMWKFMRPRRAAAAGRRVSRIPFAFWFQSVACTTRPRSPGCVSAWRRQSIAHGVPTGLPGSCSPCSPTGTAAPKSRVSPAAR